jgi:hypothetical protein
MKKMPKELLARVERFLTRVTLHSKPLPELEPAFEPQARPAVGLFARLSPEQKKRALAYKGDVTLHNCY